MRLKTITKASGCLMAAAMLAAFPAFAAPQQYSQDGQANPPFSQTNTRGPAAPGTLNYVEGQAELAGQAINQNSIGAQILPGQTVTTQSGRVEILLTPGVILRMDNNSSVTANSTELGSVQFTLNQGRAMVEADQILKDDHIAMAVDGANAVLTKKGLYEFNATNGDIRAWDGQLRVAVNGHEKTVDGGYQLAMAPNGKSKIKGFNKKNDEDAFYRWSSLRSSYLAEANVNTAGQYAYGGPGWYGPGWYWSPWFDAYTWIPGDGIFWDPFGWGFFAPGFVGYAPFYGYGGFGYGYGYGHGNFGHPGRFGPGYHPGVMAHRGFAGQEFHGGAAFGGARGFAGGRVGGFGGGFHGGMGGGGFHGGGGGGRR